VQAVKVPKLVTGLLAFAAGVVDACTYLALFGLFVAQVTGSFVIVGVQLIRLDPSSLIRVIAIPIFFVAGFITAVLVALAGRTRPALCWTLAVEIALLAGFVASGLLGAPFTKPNETMAVVTSVLGIAAMGVQSGMVRLVARGVPSTNVMTSNMTQVALDLAHWTGSAWRAWRHPHDADADIARRRARAHFGQIWPVILGFLAGTICGALIFNAIGFWCPLVSLAVLAGVLTWAMFSEPNAG
jgi:uncharacterized membrane protein YoaK (UPF0700 family)